MIHKSIRGCLLAALVGILLLPTGVGAAPRGYTVFHGDRARPDIALTVDDCYRADVVAEILDLCEQYGVPVTFFVVGEALSLEDQALWRRALARGCELGNHTWGHPRLPDLTREQIEQTLGKTQEKLERVLGYPYDMQVMRPPYGSLSNNPVRTSDPWVVAAIEAAGYLHAVRWDVDQTDPTEALDEVANGSILLYHANPKDVRCLQALIPALLEQGYRCVTVSELLGLQAPVCDARTEKQEVFP